MFISSLLCLALGAGGIAPSDGGWFRASVDVPNVPALNRLTNSDLNVLDCIPHLGSASVAVSSGEFNKLTALGLTYHVVSKLEDPSDWGGRHRRGQARISDDYRFHYFDADQMLAFYEQLRSEHPTIVSRTNIGSTINGATIWAYRIASPWPTLSTPNNVVIEGVIHAREWISGASVMHIARKMVDRFSGPLLNSAQGNQVLWVIPMANPDGYRYTWTNNRYWRKNRRLNAGGSYGVDLNRNYAKGWGGNSGSSSNPTSETYRGTSAFSEPESQAVRNFLPTLVRVGGFVDFHSYGQVILSPWGYTSAAPADAAMFDFFGSNIESSMESFGSAYDHGQTANILYIASGTTHDYVYDQSRAPAFAIELRDTGQTGFALPESQIYGTQDEVWAGFSRYLELIGP